MKHSWRYKLCVLGFALLVALPQLKAQDVMVVEWETSPGSGEPKKNALWEAIMGDTVAGGARANLNRVYQLKKGGYYWITERIVNDGWPLRIVGEPAGTTAAENPPVIQMVARDNGTVDGRMITGLGDLELRNLWLTGRDDNGVQTYYQPIQFDGNGYTIIVDNCILEQTNFALLAVTGKDNKIFFTNNKFRNLVGKPSSQQWEGRGISIWADADTVVVENNTFFNLQFTVLQIEGGSAKYLRFNHNTMVNVGRNFMTGNWFQEAYFANNLIINGFWHGEGYNDYSAAGRDPRAYYSGMWSIGALPTKYGLEEGRRILLANTAAWRDPFFQTKYGDTIRVQYFTNRVTREDFLDKLNDQGTKAYIQMNARDTIWLTERPNFSTYPGVDPNYPTAMLDSMWNNISQLRQGITPAADYHYYPTEYPVQVRWPLPENFAYTTPANLLTAGTDGLPLGDLNWFPTQKAQFEANKAQYIQQLQDLAGPKIVIEPVADYECEEGTLGGTATVAPFSGFSYFQMDGGGWIQWDFDLTTGGQYDLNIWTHLRGNGTRGQRIKVNGVSIHDPMNWGEYIWSPSEQTENIWYGKIPNNEWCWTRIKQSEIVEAGALTLNAGSNTIRIESSWGWQNFAGIDILPPDSDTPVLQLRAPDATFEVVQLKAEGAPWVPSKFKSVALGTNGSVTLTVNVTEAGDYLFALYYQNGSSSAKNVQVQIDGGAATTMSLPGKTDSTGLNKTSNVFPLTAGNHTITISGADVNIDYIKLSKQQIITSVDANTPSSFALEQNYPNPFNPTTTINFSLAKATNVKLVVYNILGQKVATLIDARMEAGPHTYVFDGGKLASGVYFYKLEAGDFRAVKKMLLLK